MKTKEDTFKIDIGRVIAVPTFGALLMMNIFIFSSKLNALLPIDLIKIVGLMHHILVICFYVLIIIFYNRTSCASSST